jgi:iron complex transport system permease protein
MQSIENLKDYNNKEIKGFGKTKPLYIGVILLLLVGLILSILYAVTIGSSDISVKQVYEIIIYKLFNIGNESNLSSGAIHDVVWLIRLPRIILALCVGIGLSVSGVVMQSVAKNSLADPYILGVSSGASLGATIAIMLGLTTIIGANSIGVFAFIGALLVSILVLLISNTGGRSNSTKLLLSGMALSSVCSAFSSFIVYIKNDAEGMKTVTFWLMGSLAGAKWEEIIFILPLILLGLIFFISQYRILNLMLLGDEVSITLGTDLHKYRKIYLIVTSIMVGLVVYSSGMIGFVGLIIPHIVRIFFGTDHKKVIPISALLGAIFLIWADVLSRIVIKNAELPIGILISIIGAPFFVYLMIKKTYGFGGTN